MNKCDVVIIGAGIGGAVLSLALGSRGSVPPWLAAWAPNLLFSATGIALTWLAR